MTLFLSVAFSIPFMDFLIGGQCLSVVYPFLFLWLSLRLLFGLNVVCYRFDGGEF